MAFSDQAALVQDTDFRNKVQVAIVAAALDVVGEARPGEASGFFAFYNKRHDLGVAILNDPKVYLDRFAWAVAANPAITATSGDGDVAYTVNSVFGDIAGVSVGELPS